MQMTHPFRDIALSIHVIASVGWAGALGVFLAHALAGLFSTDEQVVRAMYMAMSISAWFVILPLSVAAFATGVIQALGTAWGLIRHYWIVFKLVMTATATVVLLMKLTPISYLAEMAAQPTFSSTDLLGLRTSTMLHAAGGVIVLALIIGLAILKPRGLTPYGAWKQDQKVQTDTASGDGLMQGTPRWVKAFAVISAIIVLMIGAMLLGGVHGPSAHMPH
jgi:hypothetical protein